MPELHAVLALLAGGFGRLRILVVGDLMLDRYVLGEVDRISPEAPVPVLRHAQRYARPGGAANVAMNLAGLGCGVVLGGFWGDDADRQELEAALVEASVETVGAVTTRQPTISKTRIVGRTQQLLRLDIEGDDTYASEDHARLREAVLALLPKVHAVVLSDYAKGVFTDTLCHEVIAAARHRGLAVLVDPKSPDFGRYTGATVVCPNLQELAGATGKPTRPLEVLLDAGERQRRAHDIRYLAVTMSERGIQLLADGERYHSPARAREVFDVSGAGDTVIATLAACTASGLQMKTAIELANLAAGVVVGKVGTAPIGHAELTAVLTPSKGIRDAEKILDRDQVIARVREWREAGESVVFTNGCFDLLHVGHVTLLEDCRRFGSKVVLALNTDASIRRLKGPHRPVVGQADRARVMAALGAVDAVTLFDEDTPLLLIEALQPDVLVKGGDYVVSTVVGHQTVLAAGGRVEIVPTVEGFSTTGILRKLQTGAN